MSKKSISNVLSYLPVYVIYRCNASCVQLDDTSLWIVGGDNHSHDTLNSTEFIKLDKGSVDLLSHFTKVKCDSWT